MINRHQILTPFALVTCCATAIGAPTPWHLYLADAGRLEGELVSITENEIVLQTITGTERIEIARVVALEPLEPTSVVMMRGTLALTDQQVLAGELVRGGDDSVTWRDHFMERTWTLDQVDAMWWEERPPNEALNNTLKVDDLVVTRSGDQLQGFVSSIGLDGVTIELDESKQTIELGQVVVIDLATERNDASGTWLWLADGSRVKVSSLDVQPGVVTCVVGGDAAALPTDQLRGILFRAETWVPLAALVPVRVSTPADRRRSPAPQILTIGSSLGLDEVLLDGPIEVTYELPPGTGVFAAELVLPEDCTRWGSYQVIMLADDIPVYRGIFDRTRRRERAQFSVPGSTLTIRILDAENGPVQDRLLLRNAFFVRDVESAE